MLVCHSERALSSFRISVMQLIANAYHFNQFHFEMGWQGQSSNVTHEKEVENK